MATFEKSSDPLENLTEEQIADLVKSNDILEEQKERMIKEELEEEERKEKERKYATKNFKRLRKSPLEIINRSLFFLFLSSFLFSFVSVYRVSTLWFYLYMISSFSCILYTPNRKALKELIDGWPNLEELIRNRIR